jgi:hypothetical protein
MRVDTRVWSPFACVPVHHEKWEEWESRSRSRSRSSRNSSRKERRRRRRRRKDYSKHSAQSYEGGGR